MTPGEEDEIHLSNVILPSSPPSARWDVTISANTITSIRPTAAAPSTGDGDGDGGSSSTPASLLLPPLCHPHIHLDKAYLLTCNHGHSLHPPPGPLPDYTDLQPRDGSFGEALSLTSRAKSQYTASDLLLRGAQLLATAHTHGATSARCFVEVDRTTGTACLEAGVALRARFRGRVAVQLCAFAQDPLFSGPDADANRGLLADALASSSSSSSSTTVDGVAVVEAVGATPYVEADAAAALANVRWTIDAALRHGLHLDFHLDYNLDGAVAPLVWDVLRLLREMDWAGRTRGRPPRTVALGHCTRLSMLTDAELARLRDAVAASGAAVYFVALPTSDLFMMGRPAGAGAGADCCAGTRPRGTLQVLHLAGQGLRVAMGVNNVGNAFTPWGTGDPLALASLGVGLYQGGTAADAELLFECVSGGARRAIGVATDQDTTEIREGAKGPWLLVRNEETVGCPDVLGVSVPARQRVSIRDVVWDVPEVALRSVVGREEG